MSTPPRGCVGRSQTNSPNNNMIPMSLRTPPMHPRASSSAPHAMSVLVTRVDLYDSGCTAHETTTTTTNHNPPLDYPQVPVAPYTFDPPTTSSSSSPSSSSSIAICRVPPVITTPSPYWMQINVMDPTIPSPNPAITKYWNQRRRLFSRFDQGIQLDDPEGWFSVTPEQIAQYVAHQTQTHYAPQILLDAFCGCGGNAIAFAQVTQLVVAVDVDRTKLRRAAHNARLYGIPPERLIFIECNVLFVLEYCYQNGQFVLDQPIQSPEQAMALMDAMPPPVATEVYEGFSIGGIDLLPRTIDTIFMDPPWGGVDYEVFGKHGYDLEHQMKIERPQRPNDVTTVQDDFFDSFASSSSTTSRNHHHHHNKQERKAQFNCTVDDSNCVNGVELLRLAAAACASVLYDIPRNTRRQSVAHAALAAGYRGNCLWEEHYLNSRLKTVTVYLGRDWSALVGSATTTKDTTTTTTAKDDEKD